MVCNRTAVVESTMTVNNAAIEECFGKIDFLLKENLMQNSYSKRMNILIHGIDEIKDKNETKIQTKELFEDFLIFGLKINPATIGIADIQRLPQHKVLIRGIPATRPIIVKLQTTFDKARFFQNAKKLKNYNEEKETLHLHQIFI